MTYEELRLATAKKFAPDAWIGAGTRFDQPANDQRRVWALAQADAALTAIREAGVRLMPEQLTEEMKSAAWKAAELTSKQSEWAYTAMLTAGEIKPEGRK